MLAFGWSNSFLEPDCSLELWKSLIWLLLETEPFLLELCWPLVGLLLEQAFPVETMPFRNYFSPLEKSLYKMGSQVSKCFEPPHSCFWDPSCFVFKNYSPSSSTFLNKCTNLTKSNLEQQWPLFDLPNTFLKAAMVLKLSKLHGMSILIGILKLPKVIRNLKLPLCKIRFLD